MIDPTLFSALKRLEESLWATETRFNNALMERLFSLDFIEFGRSGRRYARAEMLCDERQRQAFDATLHDFSVRSMSKDIALSLYISEVRYPSGTEWANRSSIWDQSKGQWQLRFHQGTPTAPPPDRG
ncbi:DUF4440 domain-containing protein [Paracoccus aurantiacus]|uniref:DUF4440 domain-containing protein n=1 Tax=Paracoccus aurantiacus TaxID=2599412 RepID=A0A5C6S3X0_9RHOB|nr:DUF4440 domain-containing protein [Paracoccus aurantiacus]TXB68680.1 DUF4440 domain-containing protein [Paracoccus aurantiacus]